MLTTHSTQLTFLCPAAQYLLLLRALLQQMNVRHQIVTGELLNLLHQHKGKFFPSYLSWDRCLPRLHLSMFSLSVQLMPDSQAEHDTPGLLCLQAALKGSLAKRGLPIWQRYGIWRRHPCSRFAPNHNSSLCVLPLCPHTQSVRNLITCRRCCSLVSIGICKTARES